jgi:predicted ATPase
MINKISFKNYKLFKEKQTLELKPITILIGKNNSGKSAVLKLMTLIEGALSGKSNNVFELKNDEVSSGDKYKDLIYGKFGRAIELELFQKDIITDKIDILNVEVSVDIDADMPVLENWSLKESFTENDNGVNKLLNFQRIDKTTYFNEIDDTEYFCEFIGIYLTNYFYKEKPDSSGTIYKIPFLKTDFIGSIREKSKQDYRLNPVNTKSHPDGRYLYDFLIRDYLTTDKKYFSKISEWIKTKFQGWELYVDVDSEPYHIELRRGKLYVNLTETGMGIGQSLPLITRAYKPCDEETLIIIEEPESHLHPFAHAQLAQLFTESIKDDTNKKYLIETHSQNFILRLRRLVAEGYLNENDLGIYYVEFDEESNEGNLREIKVDDGGGVDWWPDTIFSETSVETRAIYNAQLNDLKNVD